MEAKELPELAVATTPKGIWKAPKIILQPFQAEEYCQVCVRVVCEYGAANYIADPAHYGDTDYFTPVNGEWHRKLSNHEGCGWIENQVFRWIANDTYGLYEINIPDKNGGNPGESKATITTYNIGEEFSDKFINKQAGVEIEWKTEYYSKENKETMYFNHKGILQPMSTWGNHS